MTKMLRELRHAMHIRFDGSGDRLRKRMSPIKRRGSGEMMRLDGVKGSGDPSRYAKTTSSYTNQKRPRPSRRDSRRGDNLNFNPLHPPPRSRLVQRSAQLPGPLQRRRAARNKNAAPVGVQRTVRRLNLQWLRTFGVWGRILFNELRPQLLVSDPCLLGPQHHVSLIHYHGA